MPLGESRRADAQVHRDIEYPSLKDLHQLALRMRLLRMQAAQHAFGRHREIVLDEGFVDACLTIALFLPDFGKPAAFVSESPGCEQFEAGHGQFGDLHAGLPCCSSSSRYWP